MAPFAAYVRERFVDDPHVWASALFDEVVPLGYSCSYPSFARQLRLAGLRPHFEACAGVKGRETIEIAHPAGEEIQWDWEERRNAPWGATVYGLLGTLSHSGRTREVLSAEPVHKTYEIELPTVPIITEAEACAEKLARYRRFSLARDLDDLVQFGQRQLDEALVRRLWVLKVWAEVVDDSHGAKPLDADDILRTRKTSDFQPESIGVLTRPIDIPGWERSVRARYAFLSQLDEQEQTWARCDPRDRRFVEAATAL